MLVEPRLARRVAGAVGFEHQPTQSGNVGHCGHHFLADPREKGENGHVRVELAGRAEGRCRGTPQNVGLFEPDMDTGMRQSRIVEGTKGVEPFRIDFRGAVAAQEAVFKEDAHLGHHRRTVGVTRRGNFDAGEQIFLPVGTQLSDGQLAAGHHDGFVEVFEHETQSRCRESHRIGAVQQHKTVVMFVVLCYDFHHAAPVFRFHVRRVDRGAERDGVDVVVKAFQFRHEIANVLPIEGLERSRDGILEHADCSAGVDEKYAGCVHELCFACKLTKII